MLTESNNGWHCTQTWVWLPWKQLFFVKTPCPPLHKQYSLFCGMGDRVSAMKNDCKETKTDFVFTNLTDFDVSRIKYQSNPNLRYLYPPPNTAILTNIAHTLVCVPKFYVQVAMKIIINMACMLRLENQQICLLTFFFIHCIEMLFSYMHTLYNAPIFKIN